MIAYACVGLVHIFAAVTTSAQMIDMNQHVNVDDGNRYERLQLSSSSTPAQHHTHTALRDNAGNGGSVEMCVLPSSSPPTVDTAIDTLTTSLNSTLRTSSPFTDLNYVPAGASACRQSKADKQHRTKAYSTSNASTRAK